MLNSAYFFYGWWTKKWFNPYLYRLPLVGHVLMCNHWCSHWTSLLVPSNLAAVFKPTHVHFFLQSHTHVLSHQPYSPDSTQLPTIYILFTVCAAISQMDFWNIFEQLQNSWMGIGVHPSTLWTIAAPKHPKTLMDNKWNSTERYGAYRGIEI